MTPRGRADETQPLLSTRLRRPHTRCSSAPACHEACTGTGSFVVRLVLALRRIQEQLKAAGTSCARRGEGRGGRVQVTLRSESEVSLCMMVPHEEKGTPQKPTDKMRRIHQHEKAAGVPGVGKSVEGMCR